MSDAPDIRRVDAIAPTPWKNGGGISRSLAIAPDGAGHDDCDWRVDLSDISRAGPFSYLPDLDRQLMPLGSGLRLGFDGGVPGPVEIFETTRFAGETPVQATLGPEAPDGGLQVLNLMTRRDRFTGRVVPYPAAGRLREPAATMVLMALRGGFNLVVDGGRPAPLDAGRYARFAPGGATLAFEPYRPWSMLIAVVVHPKP
ncbi:MAG: HutD family protein [Rhodospirillales bacterium]|nr:MAG: HutD family protein [Rhodospirillales bacterium]